LPVILIASVSSAGAFVLLAVGFAIWWKKYRVARMDSAYGVQPVDAVSKFSTVVERIVSGAGDTRRLSLVVDASFVAGSKEAEPFMIIEPDRFSQIQDISSGIRTCFWNDLRVILRPISKSCIAYPVKRATELARIAHPNCTRVLGICKDLDFVVEEGHPNEINLLECIHSNRVLVRTRKHSFLVQICSGLQFMHSLHPPVVHGCIRSSSVILSHDLRAAKISVACAMKPEVAEQDIRYAAPELLSGSETASLQSDVYSLGIVLYELLTGDVAWEGLAASEISARVQSGKRPLMTSRVPPAFKPIIAQCWASEPVKRLTASSAWLQFYMLHSKESRENDPLRLFPTSFRTATLTVLDCLRPALPASTLEAVALDMPMIDEFFVTCQAQLHGLSEIEAKCLMVFMHDACSSSALAFHTDDLLSKQRGQLRLMYVAACRGNDDELVAKFEHFSFHLLSALQKLPALALGSRANLYAAFHTRLPDMHESYSTTGAVVCWHFPAPVQQQRDAALAELNPNAGGTIVELCGFSNATDVAPLCMPKEFVRQRYAKRFIVAFYRFKCRRMSSTKYLSSLRHWRAFLLSTRRGHPSGGSGGSLIADFNSCFKVEASLTWQQAMGAGISLPSNVDLLILSALPNPLPPSAMLASANGAAPPPALRSSHAHAQDAFQRKSKNQSAV
jgi:hypothetical protein